MLNLETLSIALIGEGKQFERRKNLLAEAGATKLTSFNPQDVIEFGKFDVVMIVDAPNAPELHAKAKAAKCIVNVEDEKEFCDFYFQTFIQRGDLQISVSTNGKSPGTAKLIRQKLEKDFPEIWAERIAEISALRDKWKASGCSYDEVNAKTEQYITEKNWLK